MFPLSRFPAQHISIRTALPSQLLLTPLSVPYPEQTNSTKQVGRTLWMHCPHWVYIMRHPQSQSAVWGEVLGRSGIHRKILLKGSIEVDAQLLRSARPGEANRVPLTHFKFYFQVMFLSKYPCCQHRTFATESQLYVSTSWSFVDKTRPICS